MIILFCPLPVRDGLPPFYPRILRDGTSAGAESVPVGVMAGRIRLWNSKFWT
jgi:hypothetical protein